MYNAMHREGKIQNAEQGIAGITVEMLRGVWQYTSQEVP